MARKGPWRSPLVAFRVAEHQRLFMAQGGQCAYCGKDLDSKTATFDHVWPKGGPRVHPDSQNLVLACLKCNKAKGRRDPRQFVKSCLPQAPIFRLHPELRQN